MTTSPIVERAVDTVRRETGSGPAVDAPLSAAQRRVWLLEHLRPDLVEYNMAQVFKLDGLLDVDALSAALGLVVERHTILRSRVVQDATGGPRLRVEPASTVRLQRTDLSYLAIGPAYEEAYRLRDADIDGRFDLAAGPWLRARLTELPEQRHLFTVVVHHIAVDATSMQIFWQELSQAYAAFTAGRRPSCPSCRSSTRTTRTWRPGSWRRPRRPPRSSTGSGPWPGRPRPSCAATGPGPRCAAVRARGSRT